METLQIRKKSEKVWLHRVFVDGTLIPSNDSIISKFYCKTFGDVFKIVEDSGSNRKEYNYTNISVFDDTDASTEEVFGSSQALMLRLEELKYVGFNRDGDVPDLALEDLTNVTITLPATGEVLIYNSGTLKWENQSIPEIPSTTDSLAEGVTNLYFQTARVLATVLTGISFATGGAIVSTDTILQAFGKIQKQITDALASITLKQDILTDVNFGSFIKVSKFKDEVLVTTCGPTSETSHCVSEICNSLSLQQKSRGILQAVGTPKFLSSNSNFSPSIHISATPDGFVRFVDN